MFPLNFTSGFTGELCYGAAEECAAQESDPANACLGLQAAVPHNQVPARYFRRYLGNRN
jgi:hypothetical protein